MLREYERTVVRLLTSGVLSPGQLAAVWGEGEVEYDYTGAGYFLTVRHASLPQERVVCDRPMVLGRAGGAACGFVVFIEGGTLTLECYSLEDDTFPEDFRDRAVELTHGPPSS